MLKNLLAQITAYGLLLAALIGLWYLFTRRSRAEDARRDRIRTSGRKVWATLLSKQPIGESNSSDVQVQYKAQYYVLLELDVPQPDGATARCTIKDLPAPGWRALQPGDQVQVYQELDDPMQIILDTLMTPRYFHSGDH